jgi:penicillin-binding protein 2
VNRIRRGADPAIRLTIVGIVITSLFIAMFTRLFYLQVIDGAELAAAAQANQLRTVYTEAPRGRIIDRNGNVIAGNREIDVITVERDAPSKDETLFSRLAQVLQVDEGSLSTRMKDPKASLYKPVTVAEGLSTSIVAAFRERQAEFPGVAAATHVQRWYPNGTLGAHLLGYVGEVNDSELSLHKNQGYRLGSIIGKSGIEAAYEDELRGKPGVEKIEVNRSGRVVRVLESTPPLAGDDLELTLDVNMQRAAEQSLAQAMDAAKASSTLALTGNRGGAAVAVDPRDGGVLAMASYPGFDPASFTKGISQDEYAELTDPRGALPLNNRALQGTTLRVRRSSCSHPSQGC